MNTQKGFSTILGILLVLAVLGGGTYFYTSTKTDVVLEDILEPAEKSGMGDDVVESQEENKIKVAERDAKINTTEWSTYVNNKFGFEIKYPTGYVLENRDKSGVEWNPVESLERTNGLAIKSSVGIDAVEFQVRDNEPGTLKEYAEYAYQANQDYKDSIKANIDSYPNKATAIEFHDSIQVSNFFATMLDGQKAYVYDCIGSCSTALGEGQRVRDVVYKVYFVQKGDKVIIMSMRNNESSLQMLSTFNIR